MSITLKAYAKVNVGLDITGKTDNGYHLLRSVMQQINLYDELTLEKNETGKICLSCTNPLLPCDDSNLAYRAAALIKEKYDIKEGVNICLSKNIPMAAGMAGGSTDGAAVIKGMNMLFSLNMTEEEMREEGVKLGADIPFCIMGGCALAEGIGEILTPIKDGPVMHMLISKPLLDISTKYVYTHLHLDEVIHPDMDSILKAYSEKDVKTITEKLGNVLESVSEKENQIITTLKKKMLELGAMGSLMSGSGPTVFGIFETAEEAQKAETILKELYPDIFVQAVDTI